VENPSEENSNPKTDAEDGTLDQSTIDALLGNESDEGGGSSAGAAGASDQPIHQDDIDALLGAASAAAGVDPEAESDASGETKVTPEPDSGVDTSGRPSDVAAAAMKAALEEEQHTARAAPSTGSFELPSFGDGAQPDVDPKRLSMLNDVKLRVKIELGRAQMLVEEVLKLGEGSVVELDKLAGDPVDVWVNERLIARGEVLVLNDNFCVRISEVFSNDPHRVTV